MLICSTDMFRTHLSRQRVKYVQLTCQLNIFNPLSTQVSPKLGQTVKTSTDMSVEHI